MSSPSVVRIAGPKDHTEVMRLIRSCHDENGLFPWAEDKASWFVNRMIYPETIPMGDVGVRGVIGVIGNAEPLEGIVFLTVGSHWYTHAQHIEEYLVYVDTRYRRSGHVKALVGWMKKQVELTGLPLLTGIQSTHRSEAKCRLYQRMLPKIGEFFFVTPKGSNMTPPMVDNS